VNRALYEPASPSLLFVDGKDDRVLQLKEKIWKVLVMFWDRVEND
jgi:hypothetical protein